MFFQLLHSKIFTSVISVTNERVICDAVNYSTP